MSMVKILEPNSHDFGDAVVELIKIGSRGRLIGHDRMEFEKRASSRILHDLDNMQFAKGELPIHLLAVGATEFFGNNRNGDGFKEAACRRTHNSFVKCARFYRDHLNKDPSKSYGIVKQSMYNELMHRIELICALNETKEAADNNGGLVADREIEKLAKHAEIPVSMACPKVGTLVKLRRGFLPVEQIQPGDEVLTHRGRHRHVQATLRQTKRQFMKIGTRYYGRQELEFTPDHEFFVARWRDVPSSPGSNRVVSAELSGRSRPFRKKHRDQLYAHARWMPCGDLKPGDLLLMPIYRGDGSSQTDIARARLLGYYVAEGSGTGDGYMCYTCNTEDTLREEVHELVSCSVGENTHSASEKAVNVTVYDKSLAVTVFDAVGRGVRSKVIPQEIYDASIDIKLEFVAAWLNGDGWQDEKGIHWSTCSRGLSLELQMLLASMGLPASVYRIDHTSDLPHDTPRRGDGIEYTINVSNRYSGMFVGRSKVKLITRKADKTTVFITGDYLAIPIKSVKLVEETCDVCDLRVEEDESFTAFGLAVHNCRVPFDVCSYCGNKAPTRKQYCDDVEYGGTCKAGGLRRNMGRAVMVDGDVHQLHADNTEPRFFDISHVFRPADRIAYVTGTLQKSASAGAVVSGAELAELLGVSTPYHLLASGYMPPKASSQLKLAAQLADLERTIKPSSCLLSFCGDVQDGVTFPAEAQTKFAYVLKALADTRCLLPVKDFVRLVTDYDEKQAAAIAPAIQAYLPGVYDRLTSRNDFEQLLTANPYNPASAAPEQLKQWAAKQAAAISLEEPWLTRRVRLAAVRGQELPLFDSTVTDKLAAAEGPAKELADHYALYKLAFLDEISSTSVDLPLTATIALLQNYAN